MRIIDMHCDTLMKGYRTPEKKLYDDKDYSISIKLLKENHGLAQTLMESMITAK